MSGEHFPRQADADPPLITQNVALVFAGFGLLASLSMGWTLARVSVGQPPFALPGRVAPPAASAGADGLHLVASDLKYDAKELHLPGPGQATVQLRNAGLIDHDLTVEGTRFKLFAKPGQTADAPLKIDKPGTYTYFCSLPGHREAGMTGTLVVCDGTAAPKTAARPAAKAPAVPGAAAHASHAATASTQKDGNQPLPFATEGEVKVFDLTARAVQWEVLPGVFEEAWVYNDQLPGPVIRVADGDRVRIRVKSELPEETVLHVHGPRLPNAMDGVPDVTQPTIQRGETFAYDFTASPVGTFVYHTHHNSAVQEPKGLYGVLIIDPSRETGRPVPDGREDGQGGRPPSAPAAAPAWRKRQLSFPEVIVGRLPLRVVLDGRHPLPPAGRPR